MPRAIWSGSISFGLVNIPVRLMPAVKRKTVRFNQIDARSGSRIRQLKVSSHDGTEVPKDQLVRGYEVSPDSFVVVTDEELAALDPEASRTIDVTEFVELSDIDPVFFDSAYWLVPDPVAAKAYALLASALAESGKVAIARFVMRTKQYLAAIRPRDGLLALSTMIYADEVVPASDLEGVDSLDSVEVSQKELEMAQQLIDSLSEDFQLERHEDGYRQRVLELVEAKAAGEEQPVVAAAAPAADTVIDLMAALEQSVAEAKKSRKRHPSAGTAKAESGAAKAAKKPAKRKTA